MKIPYTILLYTFAIVGFGLTGAYFAIKFKWTNESGSVDRNSRQLEAISEKYENALNADSLTRLHFKYDALNRIAILNKYQPKNAHQILKAFESGQEIIEVLKMLDAVDFKMKENQAYKDEIAAYKANRYKYSPKRSQKSVFEWMNLEEWETFKVAVDKDQKLIDS